MSSAAGQGPRSEVNEGAASAIALVAATAAVLADASPTGAATTDAILVFLGTALTVWAGAAAPWWALALGAGVAVGVAMDPLAAGLGLAAFVIAVVVGVRPGEQTIFRAVAAAMLVNALARSELGVFFGLSSIVAITACVFLFAVGVAWRPLKVQRVAVIGAVVLGVGAVVGVAMTAAAVVSSGSDLSDGAAHARRASMPSRPATMRRARSPSPLQPMTSSW